MTWSNTKCRTLAVMAFFAMSFLFPAKSYANEQDWAYVQSVGGMRIGEPKKTDVEWTLPVDIDITGAREITVKPTVMHSGMACEGIGAEFHGNNLYLALFTGQPWIGAKNGTCPPISLGHPDAGTYAVFYKGLNEEPVKVGEITITP